MAKTRASYDLSQLRAPVSKGLDAADIILTVPGTQLVLPVARKANPASRKKKSGWAAQADEIIHPWQGHEGFVVRSVLLRAAEYKEADAPTIRSSGDVASLCEWLRFVEQEHVCTICVGRNNDVRALHDSTTGAESASMVSPETVARIALLVGSPSVIVVHNHPGGRVVPSQQDLEMTRRLSARLKCFDIALLDHVIVGGRHDHYSMLDQQVGGFGEGTSTGSSRMGLPSL